MIQWFLYVNNVGENYINVENEEPVKSVCDGRGGCNDSDSDADYENLKDNNLDIGKPTPGEFVTFCIYRK